MDFCNSSNEYKIGKSVYEDMKLGVDLGGTNIKFDVVSGKTIVYKSEIKTPKSDDEIIKD